MSCCASPVSDTLPEDVREAFERCMGERCLAVERLSGGRTNTSVGVEALSGSYVLRIPGEGTNAYIDRRSEFDNMHKLSHLRFLPQICYADRESGTLVTRRIKGAVPMGPSDVFDKGRRAAMVDLLVQVHRSGEILANEFDIAKMQKEYAARLDDLGIQRPKPLTDVAGDLEEAVEALSRDYPKRMVACHGDPKLNNFLLADGRMYLIDWEYSGMADEYFDLANMVMTDCLDERRERLVIESYEERSGSGLLREKYLLLKVATDYLWIHWHLIKLGQGQMPAYNEASWRSRLDRAIGNLKRLEGLS